MSSNHTAGPWMHEGQGDIMGMENDPENGCVGIVDVACVYLRTVPGRTEANANLIASAPDLLDAVQRIATIASRDGKDIYHDMRVIRMLAIKTALKAKGETP